MKLNLRLLSKNKNFEFQRFLTVERKISKMEAILIGAITEIVLIGFSVVFCNLFMEKIPGDVEISWCSSLELFLLIPPGVTFLYVVMLLLDSGEGRRAIS
jgi:hypothetical protein